MQEITKEEFLRELKEYLTELLEKEKWTPKDLLGLKSKIYPVNAHITYLLGEKFLNSLKIDPEEVGFEYKKMYDNGFDIEIEDYNGVSIIAEIKGNIPVENDGEKYGSQQKDGIKKDIEGLTNGKSKSKKFKEGQMSKGVYKFLILLESNRKAFENLKNNLCKGRGKNKAKHTTEEFFVCQSKDYTLSDFKPDIINVIFIEL